MSLEAPDPFVLRPTGNRNFQQDFQPGKKNSAGFQNGGFIIKLCAVCRISPATAGRSRGDICTKLRHQSTEALVQVPCFGRSLVQSLKITSKQCHLALCSQPPAETDAVMDLPCVWKGWSKHLFSPICLGSSTLCDITKGKDTVDIFSSQDWEVGILEGHEGPTSTGTMVLIVTFDHVSFLMFIRHHNCRPTLRLCSHRFFCRHFSALTAETLPDAKRKNHKGSRTFCF